MPAVGKVTLDIRDYEKALAKARKDGKRFAQEFSQNFKQFGRGASKAGSQISSMSTEAGGAFRKLGGAISAVASGPIGILTAALGALVAVGVDMWDRMTLSEEEYAKKLDFAASKAEKNRAAVEKQAAEDQTYMDRLKELAGKERLSNEAKEEAATLIKILTGRYGKLGIEIDKTTGKITGMDKAQKTMLENQRKQRAYAVASQLGALKDKSAHQIKMAQGVGFWIDKALSDEERDLIRKAQYGPLDKQLEYANNMFDRSTTEEDMKKWQEVIDTLEKRRDLEFELKNLMETGAKDEKERTAQKQKVTNEAQKKLDEEQAAEKELQKQVEAQFEAEKKLWENSENLVSTLEKQLEMQKLINAGKLEEAQRQRIINELESKGINTPEYVNKLSSLTNQLNAEKLSQAQKTQAGSLYDRALRAAGKNQEADTRAALESAKKAKGGELTEEERSRTLELLDLTQQLDKMRGDNFGDLAINTNSLTARGGFATGATAPDAEKYNRIIADNGKTMLSVVQRIESLCQRFGTF